MFFDFIKRFLNPDQEIEPEVVEQLAYQNGMSRRSFMGLLGAAGVGIAAHKLFSFPTDIIIPEPGTWGALVRDDYPTQPWVALQLEAVRDQLPLLFERDHSMLRKIMLDVESKLSRPAKNSIFY